MEVGSASKPRKTSSARVPEASGEGANKRKKQRKDPGAPFSAATMVGLTGADALPEGEVELSGGQEPAGGEKTVSLKSATEVPKGELSNSELKAKELTRHRKSKQGENKNGSGAKRSDQESPAGVIKGEKADKRLKRSDPSVTGNTKASAAAATDGGPHSTKRWSQDDVIRLLEGVADCQREHGPDASSHINIIHKHLCETTAMQFSRSQLYEKLRRLRLKYEATVSWAKEGEVPAFTKPHDQAVFELAKRIWGVEEGSQQPLGIVGHEEDGSGGSAEEEEGLRIAGLYPNLREVVSLLEKESVHYMGVGLLKKGFGLIQPSKAKALEDRWKINCMAGMKFLFESSKIKGELLEACVESLRRRVP